MEETFIEEDHNVDQGQQGMFNDEFHPADMNNPDDEIGIGEGEGEVKPKLKGRTLRSSFLPHL